MLLCALELAASLVLFADRAASDFVGQRGSLLPVDERNLVAQWALTEHSVYEVGRSAPAKG